MAAEGEDRVLAAVPHPLDVDVVREVPDCFGGVDGVVVLCVSAEERAVGWREGYLCVHDTGIVEDHIQPSPLIHRLDHGLHLVLFGHIADLQPLPHPISPTLRAALKGTHVSNDLGLFRKLEDLGNGLIELLLVDVGHDNVCAILGEEDGGLQADSAGGAGDDAVFVQEAGHLVLL